MTKETNEGATPTVNTAASTAIHRAAHSTARGEQRANRREILKTKEERS